MFFQGGDKMIKIQRTMNITDMPRKRKAYRIWLLKKGAAENQEDLDFREVVRRKKEKANSGKL